MNIATTPNFASILDESPTEVARPKSLPTGTYTFIVGRWETGESSQKKTPFVRFQMRPIEAGDDVDEAELQAALTMPDGTVQDLQSKTMSHTLYTSPNAVFMLDQFHEHCGMDLSEPMSRKLRNDEVLNCQVRGYVAPRDSNNPDAPIYAEIKRTLFPES